jgi:DNA polymerase
MTYPQLRKMTGEDEGNFEYWEGKFWKRLYGPLLIENIIQALSRIIMTDMMLRIRTRITPYGAEVSLTVHDEIVVVAPDEYEEICMNIMKEEMAKCSDFCNDGKLVLSSSGGSAQNYSK